MATRIVPDVSQLLIEATSLQQRLWQMEKTIDQMDPNDQIISIESVLSNEQAQLKQLQQKAQDLFSHSIELDHPSMAVLEQLSQSVNIIQKLEHNQEFLLKFNTLFTEAQETLQQTNRPDDRDQKLKMFLARSIGLAKKYQDLNSKNAEALVQLAIFLTDQPVSQSLQRRRQLISQQNQEFQISLYQDQIKELTQEFQSLYLGFVNDPEKDFEIALSFLKKLKTFPLAVDLDNNYLSLIEKTTHILNQLIQAQERKENQAIPITTSTQTTLPPAFEELKNIIANLITAQRENKQEEILIAQRKIQPTFNQLDEAEKKRVLIALNTVLKQNHKIKEDLLENVTLKQSLALWGKREGATWEDIQNALEHLIRGSSQPSYSTTMTSSKVAEMKQRLQEVSDQPRVIKTTPPLSKTISVSQPRNFSPSHSIEEFPSDDQFPQNVLIQGIDQIKKILTHIQDTMEINSLKQALSTLTTWEREQHISFQSLFKQSNPAGASMVNQLYFHLYLIHKNEAPQKLKDDLNYGGKAFINEFPADNRERIRAAQRTMVEIALYGLEDAINFNDGASIVKFLDLLEEIKLVPQDRINNQECIAYTLYETFYHAHVTAHKDHPSLANPDAPQFQNDFGRLGMRNSSLLDVDPTVKLTAIHKVLGDLKRAWKM